MIPVIDLEGNVTEIYGRKITEGLRPGTPLHMYLPGPHKGVWNEEALMVSKEIILCESLIDALTFWCADYRNVTASYGVNGFTEDHRQAFKKHGTKKVLIAYDRDEAGEKAAARACRRADLDGNRLLPGAVSERDGRERIRLQGEAGSEEPGRAAEQSRVARQRQAAGQSP